MARPFLPPGFRFHPTDVELVMYYLKRKVLGKRLHVNAIAEVNIYKFSPWDLPDKSALKSKDLEWYFFCPREKKYASGARVKRATECGYWKTTGKDRPVSYRSRTVGTVKTLVFHLGHAPKGQRTDWVIHEYKIVDEPLVAAGVQDNYVLCKLFQKNGPGPKNGAQYGAPYNEADWADAEDTQDRSGGLSPTTPFLFHPGNTSGIEKGPSPDAGPSTNVMPANEIDDEVARLLALFEGGSTFHSDENGIEQDHLNSKEPNKDVNDIYNGLVDLDGWAPMTGGSTLEFRGLPINDSYMLESSGLQEYDYSPHNTVLPGDGSFIELNDLQTPMNEHHSTVDHILGLNGHEKTSEFCSEFSFASADQYSSAATQLPVFSEGYNQANNSLGMLHMVDDRYYQDSFGTHNLGICDKQPENAVYFIQDIERGTVKILFMSRLLESYILAAELHNAHLLYPFVGGSSIHIKAEVTHRDGECTNEALRVMMEGSCSFLWWKLLLGCSCIELLRLVSNQLLLLCFSLRFVLILYRYCCLNKTLVVFWRFSSYDFNGDSCILFISFMLGFTFSVIDAEAIVLNLGTSFLLQHCCYYVYASSEYNVLMLLSCSYNL